MKLYFNRKQGKKAKVLSSRRGEWLDRLERISGPVLDAACAGALKERLPETGEALEVSCLAAAANVLNGLAAYLEAGPQKGEEARYDALLSRAKALLDDVVSPDSPDTCPCFTGSFEPNDRLPQAGMLAFALLKAKKSLLGTLSPGLRKRLTDYLEQAKYTRPHRAGRELLFTAIIELVLFELTGNCETQNLDYAMTVITEAFCGDGSYRNGGFFHWSYENSFLLYPLLDMVLPYLPQWFDWRVPGWSKITEPAFSRYTTIQSRFLSPDGSYPVLGYGMCVRTGAFHTLAHAAWREKLPEGLGYAQTSVLLDNAVRRALDAAGTQDAAGFLQKGLCGYQPGLCEPDFTTGQLYGCLSVFAPLGLPANHAFWGVCDEKSPWQKAWTGDNIPLDRCH